jgi:hypothetical protein
MFDRRVRRPRLGLLLALACLPLLSVGLAPGCGQGEGDRCEIDDDCQGELVCDLSQGRADGVCRAQGGPRPPDASADRTPTADTAPAADRAPDLAPDASTDRPADGTPDTLLPDAGDASAADRSSG